MSNPPKVRVTFRVTLPDDSRGRTLFIVGNSPELGNWKPQSAKPLQLTHRSADSETWVCSYDITPNALQYRFFLGSVQTITKDLMVEEIVLVHSWESSPEPRQLRSGANEVADTYGCSNGGVYIDRGWLTGQTSIRLSLHSDAIRLRSPPLPPADCYFINCLPIDTRLFKARGVDFLDSNDNCSNTQGCEIATEMFVSVLNDVCAIPRALPSEGVTYNPNDFTTFRIETWNPEHLGFRIIIRAEATENSSDVKSLKEIGTAFVEPSDLSCSKRFVTASIISSDREVIGQLRVDILMTHSLEHECDMSVGASRFRKPDPDRTWFVGHRGMGRTIRGGVQTAFSGRKENTISSLVEAIRHGADFVEFDVMLSRDRVPVLHHDFVTSIRVRGKPKSDDRWIAIPVRDLDIAELESFETGRVFSEAEHNPDDRVFPTLTSCLRRIEETAGFNVEVKYCMRQRGGALEDGVAFFPDRNEYVDDILRELLRHSGNRRILLSAFDPDVCVMMREKQNAIPVLFLTQGETKKYPQYEDPRCWDVGTAIRFAVAESLRGVCVHAESLLKDPGLIEMGKRNGLWVFCWGDDNNNKENVRFLMENGVDGIIVDRIDEFIVR